MTGMHTVLFVHIVLGTVGLILGPVAMTARKRPGLHTKAGEAYYSSPSHFLTARFFPSLGLDWTPNFSR